ncbi:MAG: M48 family metalloprotease [Phycisphaera sp.]|nr:M48 family metalloprotease [Phycisphaera sp.]
MHVFVIALFVGLFLHDTPDFTPTLWALPWPARLALWLGSKAVVVALYAMLCQWTYRGLGTTSGHRRLKWLNRCSAALRVVLLGLYAMDLYTGVLVWLRLRVIGPDLALVDELVLLLPTFVAVVASWWCYYPIDRRLREATLFRRADYGLPVQPVWSRWQFILTQLRFQVAIIALPLVSILVWYEIVAGLFGQQAADGSITVPTSNIAGSVSTAGALGIFLLWPVAMRYLLQTSPLPGGELRDNLLGMSKRYRVGFRELLLWHTHGGVVNALVTGFFAPIRYVLISDALLDNMTKDQVEAVMAHELAHAKKHHFFWLLVAGGAAVVALEWVGPGVYHALTWAILHLNPPAAWQRLLEQSVIEQGFTITLVAAGWLLVFG